MTGTAGVASCGWLYESCIVNKVAWNTANEDDFQFFERGIQESLDFQQLATQWQRLWSCCSCTGSCCLGNCCFKGLCPKEYCKKGCCTPAKWAERIATAKRRVRDGNPLPPWGAPLLRGDSNPKAVHPPFYTRDEEEIKRALLNKDRVDSPLVK